MIGSSKKALEPRGYRDLSLDRGRECGAGWWVEELEGIESCFLDLLGPCLELLTAVDLHEAVHINIVPAGRQHHTNHVHSNPSNGHNDASHLHLSDRIGAARPRGSCVGPVNLDSDGHRAAQSPCEHHIWDAHDSDWNCSDSSDQSCGECDGDRGAG